MDRFDIDMIDTLKATLVKITTLDVPDEFLHSIGEHSSNEDDNICIINTLIDKNPSNIVQTIQINRYYDGHQDVTVRNFCDPTYKGPIVYETAPDIELLYNDDDNDSSDESEIDSSEEPTDNED